MPNGNGELIYGEYGLKGFWRNGVYMNSTEETNEIFNSATEAGKKYNIDNSSISKVCRK